MVNHLKLTAAIIALCAIGACETVESASEQARTVQSRAQAVLSSSVNLPDGVRFIERVERVGDEIVIPYSKYELDNGLTVVLHEDSSDPLVHVDVTYHVGSGREEIGRSGFAHFFEHMMFQGSENVGDEEHFKIVSESGGTLNGTTNSDRTNYFETVPSNQLEKVLWLEADRMGFLLPAVTQEQFEVQRETVKNERGQRVDNAPYGLRGERVGEAMFPEGHPYSWSVIGYLEDLDRANLSDLKEFFLRWYGPNNAVLTIGGDVDAEQTLAWVNQYFGSIPRGPEVAKPVPTEVTLDADRYISLEDNVSLPLIQMEFPTVYRNHPDEAPLDVLASIMGQGRTSLLYKNLVREGFAVQATTGHGCRELYCGFSLFALPNPQSGKTLTDLEKTMRDSFVEFEERGVLQDDLERVKAGIRAGNIFGLESVRGKVSQLAAFETFDGSPNQIAAEIQRYENVTADDVMRVYNQYIKDQHAVIMSIVPKGQIAGIAHPDTWDRYERNIPETLGSTGLAVRVPSDDFDRSVQPSASGENPSVKVPSLWRDELDNGIKILGALNDETPTTAISINFKAGQRYENLEQLGLASLTASMLGEATKLSTNEELSNRLAKLGSVIAVNADDENISVTVSSLTDKLDDTMEIVAERLLQPAFAESDFNRLKAQTIQGIEESKTQASPTATLAFNRLIYGADNSFAHRNTGISETVSKLTIDDVKKFYADHLVAEGTEIVVVSDLGSTAVKRKLGLLTVLDGTSPKKPGVNPYPNLDAGALYLIDKPGAAQSEIRIGKRALPFDATGQYYRAGLMNFALGGAVINSRINLNLREDKGYSYGARSFFSGGEERGFYRAQAGVRTDSTKASIIEFYKEIDSYRTGGTTAEELSFTKRAIGQRDALRYETPFQKLGFLGQIQTYDLPNSFVDTQNSILAGISEAEINSLASELLNSEDMILVVVGDKKVILPELSELGREIIELDNDGNLVK